MSQLRRTTTLYSTVLCRPPKYRPVTTFWSTRLRALGRTKIAGRACRVISGEGAGLPSSRAKVRVSPEGGNGGGGHSYQMFGFRNIGGTTCILRGYPPVVASAPG